MNTSWAGGSNTYPKLSSEFGVGTGHKGGSLFMPDMNEPYLLFLLSRGLKDSVDAIPGKTEYSVDPQASRRSTSMSDASLIFVSKTNCPS
jgi:hypothetical protein